MFIECLICGQFYSSHPLDDQSRSALISMINTRLQVKSSKGYHLSVAQMVSQRFWSMIPEKNKLTGNKTINLFHLLSDYYFCGWYWLIILKTVVKPVSTQGSLTCLNCSFDHVRWPSSEHSVITQWHLRGIPHVKRVSYGWEWIKQSKEAINFTHKLFH